MRKLTLLSGPIYYFHYVVILFFDVIGIERSSGKNLFIYIVLCILIAYVGMRVEKLERKGIKYLCSIIVIDAFYDFYFSKIGDKQ